MSKRRSFLLAALSLALLAGSVQAQNKTVAIGYQAPLSGENAQYGLLFRNSAMLAVDEHYGVYRMEVLINDLLKSGARREHLEAKVFGGGNVLPGMTSINVGARNARFVLNYLQTDNIPVLVEDLLDIYPRKVCFFPHSGKVMVRKLKQNLDTTVLTSEREYQKRLGATLKQAPVSGGDIDLF